MRKVANHSLRVGPASGATESPVVPGLGEGALVEAETHRILLAQRAVEDGFEQPVGSERLADAPPAAKLGPQLHRTEPTNVLWGEEHRADDGLGAVRFDGETRQNDLLDEDAVGVARLEGPGGNQP